MTRFIQPTDPPHTGSAGRRRGRLTVVAAVAAASLALAACGSSGSTPSGSQTPSGSVTPSASASTTPSTSPTPSTDPCVTVTKVAGIYYVDDVVNVGPRLYREFAKVGTCEDPITESLTHMFEVPPVDPDYTSLWPATTKVLSVATSGTTATVDLSGFVSLGAAFESAAVQQLVWTATAADKSVSAIKLLVNGATPPSGHSDWSKPVGRANALDTLAYVWILQPTQGASVTSPVKVRVYGTGYEGNVPIKVFKNGVLVASTQVTTMMGGFAEASTLIRLRPGTYVIKAYNDNGKDSTLQLWDTKRFSVR